MYGIVFFLRQLTAEVAVTVIVDEGADEFIRLEHRKQLKRLRLGQNVAGFEQLAAGHQVIALDTGVVVRQQPPPLVSQPHNDTALNHFKV